MITDTDQFIDTFSEIHSYSNYATSYGASITSGTLATHDSNNNPIVNPSVSRSSGGTNTFTYFVIAREVDEQGYYSDRFTPADNAGTAPPPRGTNPNGTNDGEGTTQQIIVTVNPS